LNQQYQLVTKEAKTGICQFDAHTYLDILSKSLAGKITHMYTLYLNFIWPNLR